MPLQPVARERKAKILYIEDNPENRMLARAVLEADGYKIVEAEEGLAGIETALREQPALILLDINLPGVDGYEVAAVIKSFPTLATTPVIAVTAYAMEGDRQRTLVAGCDGYIQKPIDIDRFPKQVADFLQGKRERLEASEERVYLRELNQRLVYRLVNQVEELKRLNQHFVQRASQLEELHGAMQDITAELGVTTLLERLLPSIARALGATGLIVELSDPAGVRVAARGVPAEQPLRLLARPGPDEGEWMEAEWKLPLVARGRTMGQMIARHVVPPGAKADEEQLLKVVANQVAIAVENAHLYDGVKRQMAELRQAQAQLIQSTKLAAIGELVANVAHEINNPLTSVLGFASYLAERLPSDNSMRDELNLIIEEAARARDIVRDLLDFSRRREFSPEPTNVNVVLEQTVAMVRRQGAPESVSLYEVYGDGLPPILVDISRMKQVFLNIITNALYAMSEGGSLTMRTFAADGVVHAEFTDTGTGITPEHIDRIFDPFFTTKPEVSGTGLGLSVSLGIVQSHGGTIEVRSEVGKGSTFTVKLPVKPAAPPGDYGDLAGPTPP